MRRPEMTTDITHPAAPWGSRVDHAWLPIHRLDVHANVLWHGLRDGTEDEPSNVHSAVHRTQCGIGLASTIRVQNHLIGEY